MPLGHLLAPQIAKKTAEIEAQLAPIHGYLQAQPQQMIALPTGAAPLSEAQAYADVDRQRTAATAGDKVRTRALEAMGSRGTRGSIDGGAQVGGTNIELNAKIDRLGNKPTWTGADLNGLTEGEIAAARLLRKQREAAGTDPNTIQSPGYLPKVGVKGKGRNARVEVERTGIPLEGVRVAPFTGGYIGTNAPSPYAPQAPAVAIPAEMARLGAQQEGLSHADAASIIADDLRKRFAYLAPSA
jgi:hypothetical protein